MLSLESSSTSRLNVPSTSNDSTMTAVGVTGSQSEEKKKVVGFTVDGEKIISAHYADDATIIIHRTSVSRKFSKKFRTTN